MPNRKLQRCTRYVYYIIQGTQWRFILMFYGNNYKLNVSVKITFSMNRCHDISERLIPCMTYNGVAKLYFIWVLSFKRFGIIRYFQIMTNMILDGCFSALQRISHKFIQDENDSMESFLIACTKSIHRGSYMSAHDLWNL